MAQEPGQDRKCHCDILKGLLSTEDHCDMELQHPDKTFRLHKAVVLGHSPVITAAFTSGFQETETCALKVYGSFPLKAVQRMVNFFYAGTYSIDSKEISSPTSPKRQKISSWDEDISFILTQHIHVYEIADYYDIKTLKDLAIQKIESLFDKDWSTKVFIDAINGDLNKVDDEPVVEMLARTLIAHYHELVELDEFKSLIQHPTLAFNSLTCAFNEFEQMVQKVSDAFEEARHKSLCKVCSSWCKSLRVFENGFRPEIGAYCSHCGTINDV